MVYSVPAELPVHEAHIAPSCARSSGLLTGDTEPLLILQALSYLF